jgi:hypothetical protein
MRELLGVMRNHEESYSKTMTHITEIWWAITITRDGILRILQKMRTRTAELEQGMSRA